MLASMVLMVIGGACVGVYADSVYLALGITAIGIGFIIALEETRK